MTKLGCTSLPILAIFATVCAAQTPSTHVSVRHLQRYRQDNEAIDLQRIISQLKPEMLAPAVPGSWEEQVMKAATRSAGLVLQVRLETLTLVGLYTLSTTAGDTLVARWDAANSQRPERAIWLWDTPSYTAFVFEGTPGMLLADELTRYSEELFTWDKDPIHLKSLQLTYLAPDSDGEWVIGAFEHIKTETGSYHVWFAATSDKRRACATVGFSKATLSSQYPPDAVWVAERFPPLQSRLARVPRQDLFEELAHGPSSAGNPAFRTNRDAIVLSELLARGPLSDSEVRTVVIGDYNKGDYQSGLAINSRVIAFVQTLEMRGELAQYTDALQNAFASVPINRGTEDAVIGHVFGAMAAHHVDFTRAALAFLEREQFVRSSLYYLEKNAREEKTLLKLTEIRVGPELEKDKQDVVENIKRKLHSN